MAEVLENANYNMLHIIYNTWFILQMIIIQYYDLSAMTGED